MHLCQALLQTRNFLAHGVGDMHLVKVCTGCVHAFTAALDHACGGLLISHTFDENEISDGELYRELLFGKLSLNEGMFYENAIAQMLVATGHKLYFYVHYDENRHRNDIEIDFIISNKSKLKYKIFPIEVKSSERYSTLSLDRFKEKYSRRIGGAYIIHPKNLKDEDGVLRLPPYMTFCL